MEKLNESNLNTLGSISPMEDAPQAEQEGDKVIRILVQEKHTRVWYIAHWSLYHERWFNEGQGYYGPPTWSEEDLIGWLPLPAGD